MDRKMTVLEGLRKTGFGLFFVLALLGSLGFASRPKLPAGNFVEQGAVIPIRLRHPCFAVLVVGVVPASSAKQGWRSRRDSNPRYGFTTV
jgi:hypothetical protein